MMRSTINHTLAEFKIAEGQKARGRLSVQANGEELFSGEPFDMSEFRCVNCEGFSESFLFSRRDGNYHTQNFYLCSNCKIVYSAHERYCYFGTSEDKKLETKEQKVVRLHGLKIYNLRKHQRSIKAILTLLNHKALPNDLVRTLKGYLY